jgi:hypothetical protein
MEAANEYFCRSCGKFKHPDGFIFIKGKRTNLCRECNKSIGRERYLRKNPSAKRIERIKEDDFHCKKCGELKTPEQLLYRKGRRLGTCKVCDRKRRRELFHKNHPKADCRGKFNINDLHCTRCGELKKPGDFLYVEGRRQGLCKDCIRERGLELYHINNLGSIYKNTRPRKLEEVIDYGEKRHLIGKYKICPVCGIEKPLADFSREKLWPIVHGRYQIVLVFLIREFYKECNDCRIRMHELHDHFLMAAY